MNLTAMTVGMLGAVVSVMLSRAQPAAVFALIVLAVCMVVFASLTIEIGDGQLTWRFGPGVIRKAVPRPA